MADRICGNCAHAHIGKRKGSKLVACMHPDVRWYWRRKAAKACKRWAARKGER